MEMQNRVPVPRSARPDLPDFDPVPRQKVRHDGWTPERQKAFIEALADTGSVSRAAGMVNMAQANCYTLRRAPGAESFRRAWEAALDFGVARMKDIAFERAIDGYLVPVFVAGRLMGFRRKTNDALLMFCLRHYGQDASGKRTTVNYFSTRAEAGAVAGAGDGASGAGAVAQASASVETVVSTGGGGGRAERLARDDELALALQDFAGVELDATAQAAIDAALADYAQRRREADANIDEGGSLAIAQEMADVAIPFVRVKDEHDPYWGTLEPPQVCSEFVPFVDGEPPWRRIGAEAIAADMGALEGGDGDPPETRARDG
jgi:hypothetical protein